MAVHLRIIGTDLPGLTAVTAPAGGAPSGGVHVGVQRKTDVVDLVRGDAAEAVWTFDVDVRAGRFAGPYVHGRGDERFVYLAWGVVTEGRFSTFRRAKLRLESLDPHACDGRTVEGRLGLTDATGRPVCASVRPPQITWTID